MYYRICERCGAHLDPGETCDCEAVDVPEMEMLFSKRRPARVGYEMDSYAREVEQHEHALA